MWWRNLCQIMMMGWEENVNEFSRSWKSIQTSFMLKRNYSEYYFFMKRSKVTILKSLAWVILFMLTAHHYSYVSHAILNLGSFMDSVCIPCTYFLTFAYAYHKAKHSLWKDKMEWRDRPTTTTDQLSQPHPHCDWQCRTH